jgi:dsDNA-specific endonuclease/ATPase MutS2
MSDAPFDMPIDGELDLHTFRAKDVPALLDDYIAECARKNIPVIRIAHGKGTGTLRELVHKCLKKNPHIAAFRLAPPEAGGWGATIAILTPGTSLTNPAEQAPHRDT